MYTVFKVVATIPRVLQEISCFMCQSLQTRLELKGKRAKKVSYFQKIHPKYPIKIGFI